MAIVTVPVFTNSPPYATNSVAPNFTSLNTINVSGDKFGMVFQVPKSGTLDKFEICTATVGNNPDNGLRFSFQDISATGIADGTQDQYSDLVVSPYVSNTWYAPAVMTHDGSTGGTKRTVTKGDWLCCVVEFVSFTASDSLGFRSWRMTNVPTQGSGYFLDGSTGTFAKGSTGSQPVMALKYNDGTYANLSMDFIYPISDLTTYSIHTGTATDEVAQKFTPAFDCRVTGAWFHTNSANPFNYVLYDSGSSVLATGTQPDADYDPNLVAPYTLQFDSAVTLAAGSTYRLAYKPTTGSATACYGMVTPSAAHLAGLPWGAGVVTSTRADAGAWTDLTVEQLMCGLIFDGLDDGAGGGGGGATAHTFIG